MSHFNRFCLISTFELLPMSMKYQAFLVLTFLSVITLQAQTSAGKVIDAENASPLNNVLIQNSDGSVSTSTNETGEFSVPINDSYIFSKKGFNTRTVFIASELNNLITLTSTAENLGEVVIVSNNFKSKLKTLPSAISTKSAEELKQANSVNIAPLLNTVPGIYMHNGTLTTNRITIRGIGSRNLFGTSKIRAYYEDIPLTDGSGSSTIEDIEIRSLGRIEITKGPSSSKYGAGLGGTLQLIPDKGILSEISANTDVTFGSFGLQKYVLQGNVGNGKNSGKITYSNTHVDGYRDNNETNRQTITLATRHLIDDRNRLTFIGNFINLKAQIPSSLNEEDFINNPTNAAFTWGRAMGFEDYKRELFGLSWTHDYSEKTKQHTSVFSSFLNSYEPRPFNILEERTRGIGLRSRINSKLALFGKSLQWTLGGEVFSDSNDFQTYENLFEDFPVEVGSVQGELRSDFKEKRRYFNLFADSQYDLSNKTTLSFGINLNYTSYHLEDSFENGTPDFSGDYDFNPIVSPKLGATHQLSENSMVYGSISHGFSPPTLEETLLPDGLINTNIEPETGWNYEIGSRGDLFNNRFHYELSLYTMSVKNLLVARRTAADEFIGINAGKTRYNGLEAAINYQLISTNTVQLYHSNAFAYNDFKFRDFVDDANDFSGNDLTGVPDVTFNSSIRAESVWGIYALINYNYVGAIPIRDDNSVFSDSYQIVTAKLGFKTSENKKFQINIYGGINNLFDETYASMLLINAGSFGGNAPRYFYPGEPINYYAGGKLTYLF